jgi:hypothetical protein
VSPLISPDPSFTKEGIKDSSPWKGEAGREFMENSGVPNFLLDKDIWRGQTESV